MRKVFFGVLVFILAFAVPVTVYSIVSNSSDFDSRDQAADSADSENESIRPQVISVPLTSVSVGVEYSYQVVAVDEDSDVLEYRVKQHPSWMTWDEVLMTLEGVPGEGDVGTHTVEVVVSDGKSLGTQTYEIVVDGDGGELEEGTDGNEDSSNGGGFQVNDQRDGSSEERGGETLSEDTSDYGLIATNEVATSQETEGASSGAAILGETTELPNTASFRGVIGLAFGMAIVSLALYLWADARWNVSDRVVSMFNYQRGRQIGMDMGNGVTVKKRKIRL